jgi:hypothetical protein
MSSFSFKTQASELNAAIDLVKIVTPRPFDKNNTSGFLFVIRGERGYVYSHDAMHTTRADFPIFDVTGEGAFIYPGTNIHAFSFLKNVIGFDVKNEEGDFSVTYDGGNGAGKAPRPLFNPKFMETCDKALEVAGNKRTFSAGALRECLNLGKEFQADEANKGEEDNPFRSVQVFDKNVEADDPAQPGQKTKPYEHGDGFMFASDRVKTIHIQSTDFMGKSLLLHANHMPLLMAFLAKTNGPVDILTGTNKSFAVDSRGRVFGWAHSLKSHSKFAYSTGLKGCDAALTIKLDKGEVLHAIKYMQAEFETGRDKTKVIFKDGKIQLQLAEGKGIGLNSMFVDAPLEPASTGEPSFEINVNIKWLLGLFESAKSNKVELRVSVMNADGTTRKKQAGAFRTFDEFILDADGKVVGGNVKDAGTIPKDAIKCRVTRYAPSYVE